MVSFPLFFARTCKLAVTYVIFGILWKCCRTSTGQCLLYLYSSKSLFTKYIVYRPPKGISVCFTVKLINNFQKTDWGLFSRQSARCRNQHIELFTVSTNGNFGKYITIIYCLTSLKTFSLTYNLYVSMLFITSFAVFHI